jgi:hypothetical protein
MQSFGDNLCLLLACFIAITNQNGLQIEACFIFKIKYHQKQPCIFLSPSLRGYYAGVCLFLGQRGS